MKILAWDTSSRTGAVAALESTENVGGAPVLHLRGEMTLSLDVTHSERLLWAIHSLLDVTRWKLEEVDCFGVGVGPGSFTGLRIGVTTARTLGHSLKKAVVPVSSLAALARPAAAWLGSRDRRTVLIAATDAAKGELFTLVGAARSVVDCVTAADGDHPGLWKRGVEEAVLAPAELVKRAKKKLSEGETRSSWLVLGEAAVRYPDLWKALPKARRIEVADPALHLVQGRWVAQLAWEAAQAGLAREALEVRPRYLRAADAEVKLKAGLIPQAPMHSPRKKDSAQ